MGGRQLKQLTRFDATMYAVSIHPNGQLLAAAGADRKVHLLDIITGSEQRVLEGHTDYIHDVTFNPAGDRVLSYGYAGHLKFWNLADGAKLLEQRIGRVGNSARYSPDGKKLVLANGDGTARVINNEGQGGGYPVMKETRQAFNPDEWDLRTMERRSAAGAK